MKKAIFEISVICLLLPLVSAAQDIEAEQKLARAGYILSAQANRLNILRNTISEISRKNTVLNEENSLEGVYIHLLMENIFLIETICTYESLFLGTLESLAAEKKKEQYRLHYTRLEKDTLKRLYQNFKSTQSNFARIENKDINLLSGNVKKESLRVLSVVEAVIKVMKSEVNRTL